MSIRTLFFSPVLAAALASSLCGYTVSSNYDVTVIASTVTQYDYTQFEGVSKSGDTLYVGNFDTIKQVNLRTGVVSNYGSLPGNNGISHVTYANGRVYAASFTSFSAPYPYRMHSVEQGGTTSTIFTMDGIFDAKTSPSGNFYFVANPDLNKDGKGDGSRLYRLNYDDNSVTEVAYLGGASGGLAFDSDGNLFYSHYDDNMIYRFGADQLAGGNLDISDATRALALDNPGYLDFNSKGQLIASRLTDDDKQIISVYDLVDKSLIEDVFIVELMEQNMMGGFVSDGDTLYVISQVWDFNGDYGSELLALTQVPEPAAFALVLGLAAAGVLWRRRR